MRMNYWEKADEFYDFQVPGYVRGIGKTFIKINASDWQGSRIIKIVLEDVIKYYAYEARSMSGCRTLAGFTSDWRGVDMIAKECLGWFKFVNAKALRKTARKYGIEPRF